MKRGKIRGTVVLTFVSRTQTIYFTKSKGEIDQYQFERNTCWSGLCIIFLVSNGGKSCCHFYHRSCCMGQGWFGKDSRHTCWMSWFYTVSHLNRIWREPEDPPVCSTVTLIRWHKDTISLSIEPYWLLCSVLPMGSIQIAVIYLN